MKNDSIKKIDENIKYTGKLIQIVNRTFEIIKKDFKDEFTIEIARRPPGVRLIIVNEEKILLTKEYRSELETWDYRLAGGKVFDSLEEYLQHLEACKNSENSKNTLEMVEKAVIFEGIEEAGINIKKPEFYYKSTSGSTIDWDLYYYLISDFEISPTGNEVEDAEIIYPEWFSMQEAALMCTDGRIKEDRSIGVLLKYFLSKGIIKIPQQY